jgi:hypothetical protein
MTTSSGSNGLWRLKLSTFRHSTGQPLGKNFSSNYIDSIYLINCVKDKKKKQLFGSRRILQMTNGVTDMGDIHWELTVCLLIAWVLLYATIRKSVRWSGIAVKIAFQFP